jgi:hypothetical protein
MGKSRYQKDREAIIFKWLIDKGYTLEKSAEIAPIIESYEFEKKIENDTKTKELLYQRSQEGKAKAKRVVNHARAIQTMKCECEGMGRADKVKCGFKCFDF